MPHLSWLLGHSGGMTAQVWVSGQIEKPLFSARQLPKESVWAQQGKSGRHLQLTGFQTVPGGHRQVPVLQSWLSGHSGGML